MDNSPFSNRPESNSAPARNNRIGEILAEHGIKKVLLCYARQRPHQARWPVCHGEQEPGSAWRRVRRMRRHRQQSADLEKVREAITLLSRPPGRCHPRGGRRFGADKPTRIAAEPCMKAMYGICSSARAAVTAALPMFDIPTAGCDVANNNGAVVTNDETMEKFAIFVAAYVPGKSRSSTRR